MGSFLTDELLMEEYFNKNLKDSGNSGRLPYTKLPSNKSAEEVKKQLKSKPTLGKPLWAGENSI